MPRRPCSPSPIVRSVLIVALVAFALPSRAEAQSGSPTTDPARQPAARQVTSPVTPPSQPAPRPSVPPALGMSGKVTNWLQVRAEFRGRLEGFSSGAFKADNDDGYMLDRFRMNATVT